MSLAQRLNELAQANSAGLLSDDDYRLLRRSAFEQYSGNAVIPAESPVVPIASARYDSPPKRSSTKPPFEQHKSSTDIHHSKLSAGIVVTNLIRRATGRHGPPSRPSSSAGVKSHEPLVNPQDSQKRGILPRLFQKKPHDLPPLRINGSQPHSDARSPSIPDITPKVLSPPPTPSHSGTRKTSSKRKGTPISSVPDSPVVVTADDAHVNSRELRAAITSTEAELQRLVEAFSTLEQGAARRIKRQNARRLPAATPANVDVLLEGREWREHRMFPSPSTPLFEGRGQRHHLALEALSDGLSVHSGHSDRTSFSHSKSIASLPKHSLGSPLSPHFRIPSVSLQRKSSISSVSSRGTSFRSSNRLAVAPGSNISHSSTHLPIPDPQSISTFNSMDETLDDLDGFEDDGDQASELDEIQQRKNEVIARYTQRIEYLKAKQKGAELHEKLLRK